MIIRLSTDAFATPQEAVELGISPNQNSFIDEALRLRGHEVRHARMRLQATTAMSDRGYVEDIRETMRAFDSAYQKSLLPEPDAERAD